MATLVGKVGMVMKGNWSSSATYEVLDTVSYNGGLYTAKQNVPANTAPTNTTYWQAAASLKIKVEDFSATTNSDGEIITSYTIADGPCSVVMGGGVMQFALTRRSSSGKLVIRVCDTNLGPVINTAVNYTIISVGV